MRQCKGIKNTLRGKLKKCHFLNVFLKVWKQHEELHEHFYVADYEEWLLFGKVTLVRNLLFMAIRCVTVMWRALVWGGRRAGRTFKRNTTILKLWGGSTHSDTRKLTSAQTEWRKQAEWGGETMALLANIFGSLVNISFDNARMKSEHLLPRPSIWEDAHALPRKDRRGATQTTASVLHRLCFNTSRDHTLTQSTATHSGDECGARDANTCACSSKTTMLDTTRLL